MLLSEVMELPASEIEFWRIYYSIVPFPNDREDERVAMQTYSIVSTLLNIGGMKTQTPLTMEMFMPDYWDERHPSAKSEEEKLREEREFVQLALASGFAVMEKS